MCNDSEEGNPDWNVFWSYIPSPNDPHEFGECMEDWRDYEWRKEQKEMDCRRKDESAELFLAFFENTKYIIFY